MNRCAEVRHGRTEATGLLQVCGDSAVLGIWLNPHYRTPASRLRASSWPLTVASPVVAAPSSRVHVWRRMVGAVTSMTMCAVGWIRQLSTDRRGLFRCPQAENGAVEQRTVRQPSYERQLTGRTPNCRTPPDRQCRAVEADTPRGSSLQHQLPVGGVPGPAPRTSPDRQCRAVEADTPRGSSLQHQLPVRERRSCPPDASA